jgi:hypothetical protein
MIVSLLLDAALDTEVLLSMPLELWISSMLLHLRENSSEIGRLFMLS